MWGPHDSAPTPSGQLVFDALAHKLPLAIPPGGTSVVDARDVAIGMLRMAQGARSGERYIFRSADAELGEIFANLALLTGAKSPKTKDTIHQRPACGCHCREVVPSYSETEFHFRRKRPFHVRQSEGHIDKRGTGIVCEVPTVHGFACRFGRMGQN